MMNERIKELAVQARNYALDEKRIYERIHNTEQCMEEYREVYNKKFAELIVQECQTVVEWAISVDSTINRVPVLIKEHFGVEE
jgi:DNA integrity scanning protein DisA with diadenylate cyclase activity